MDDKVLLAKKSSDKVLKLTNKAIKKLNSAGRWGMLDILGGNRIISGVKRHKIGKYRDLLKEIEKETNILNSQLKGLKISRPSSPHTVNTGILGHIIDIFADNFVIDIISQRDIGRARSKLKDFRSEIIQIQKQLDRL